MHKISSVLVNKSRPDPTIDDVARTASVGRATAARALGNYGSVRPTTRATVLAAAARLGYRKNSVARNVATGVSNTVGVVLADIENPFFASAIRGITDAAHESGFHVIVANTDEDISAEQEVVEMLLEKRVDGILIAPAHAGRISHLNSANDGGTPVVLFDRTVPGRRFSTVTSNNRTATRAAITRLLDMGHRRICFLTSGYLTNGRGAGVVPSIASDEVPVSCVQERYAGYVEAHRRAGVPVINSLVRRSEYSSENACQEVLDLFTTSVLPSAMFCTDTLLAIGLLQAVHTLGLRVPQDLSIVVFDESPWCKVTSPQLSVVAQPVYEIGACAARELIKAIRGEQTMPTNKRIQCKFIARGSVGAVNDEREPMLDDASS